MTENYFDGEWRQVTDLSDKALERLRSRGFVFGTDDAGSLMARWPTPAAPVGGALTFTGIPLAYWQNEVSLGCLVALERLKTICRERGCDYDLTVAGLRG